MLIVLGVLVFIAIFLYNGLVSAKNAVMDAWSNIDVALKKRYDLIPNLVNTVKGYAAHETGTFERVIAARNAALSVPKGDINGQIAADQTLTASLRQVFALAESYPDLKANTNFLQLQGNLNEIETNLENSRRYYNATVRENNNKVEGFPGVLLARSFGFLTFDFFETDEQSRQNVTVQF
ncbi:MAG: LemA family protein [Saprospiraceae bacterium]|nr:LemA family protein [Saprospiraceae bacterium]MBK8449414.1 LemA family protein [Saprospiraceae bacterium]MBK8484524.1 LemA family protein [Saprospiraceae bacterium]MBK9221900.1 LemA family protein [Saprospiraceae bacterium]MBK9721160.1 LemA family protein [Saprospiraceae bacterium]